MSSTHDFELIREKGLLRCSKCRRRWQLHDGREFLPIEDETWAKWEAAQKAMHKSGWWDPYAIGGAPTDDGQTLSPAEHAMAIAEGMVKEKGWSKQQEDPYKEHRENFLKAVKENPEWFLRQVLGQ